MTRVPFRACALLLSLSPSACAAAFTPPELGGAAWVEGTSPNFVLYTDLPEPDARDALRTLERSYTMLAEVAFPSTRQPPRTRIIHFQRSAEYEVIAPPQTGGYFTTVFDLDEGTEPLAVTYGDLSSEPKRRSVQHELTHRFVSYYYPKAPPWLNEGLAEYFETMTVEGDEIVLGLPAFQVHLQADPFSPRISLADVPSVRAVFALEGSAFLPGSEELFGTTTLKRAVAARAGAWALVHMLKNGPELYRRRFDDFVALLQQGLAVSSTDELSSLNPDTFEDDFRDWLFPFTQGGSVVRRGRYEEKDVSIEGVRPMSPAEVHLLWAALRPEQVEAEIEAALRFEPGSWRARLRRARLHEKQGSEAAAEQDFEGALAQSEGRPECVLALLGFHARRSQAPASGRSKERAEALLAKLPVRRFSVSEQEGLARSLALLGRPGEALQFARRAVDGDPSCWRCYDTLARIHAVRGEFDEATITQSLAIERLPHGLGGRGMLDRLATYEKAATAERKKGNR